MEDDQPTISSRSQAVAVRILCPLDVVEKIVEPLEMPHKPYGQYEWVESRGTYNEFCVGTTVCQEREYQRQESLEPDRTPYHDREDNSELHQRLEEQPHRGLQQLLESTEEAARRCTSLYFEDGRINPLLAPFLDRGQPKEETKTPWIWSITLQRWYREDKVTNTRIFQPPNPMMRVYLPRPGTNQPYDR